MLEVASRNGRIAVAYVAFIRILPIVELKKISFLKLRCNLEDELLLFNRHSHRLFNRHSRNPF